MFQMACYYRTLNSVRKNAKKNRQQYAKSIRNFRLERNKFQLRDIENFERRNKGIEGLYVMKKW